MVVIAQVAQRGAWCTQPRARVPWVPTALPIVPKKTAPPRGRIGTGISAYKPDFQEFFDHNNFYNINSYLFLIYILYTHD